MSEGSRERGVVVWGYCGIKGAGLANEFIEVLGWIGKARPCQAGWRAKRGELLPFIRSSKRDNLLKNNQILTSFNLELGSERELWF